MEKLSMGLGRLHIPDKRDERFPLKAIAPRASILLRRKYHYATGWWGNQGQTSQCVAYSFVHWLEDGPVTQKGLAPIINPEELYRMAQKEDEWPGEGYDGTSVRAGAKVLQALGFIESYYWGFSLEDLIRGVFTAPVVVGTNWYEDMFTPNGQGLIKVSGQVVGGHAYLINGVSLDKQIFRIKNSWGKGWGKNGHATISFNDMARLIEENGEVCLAVESEKKVESVDV